MITIVSRDSNEAALAQADVHAHVTGVRAANDNDQVPRIQHALSLDSLDETRPGPPAE